MPSQHLAASSRFREAEVRLPWKMVGHQSTSWSGIRPRAILDLASKPPKPRRRATTDSTAREDPADAEAAVGANMGPPVAAQADEPPALDAAEPPPIFRFFGGKAAAARAAASQAEATAARCCWRISRRSSLQTCSSSSRRRINSPIASKRPSSAATRAPARITSCECELMTCEKSTPGFCSCMWRTAAFSTTFSGAGSNGAIASVRRPAVSKSGNKWRIASYSRSSSSARSIAASSP
mmetsp:Transcript_67693/g.196035  ORF Transcript_67693/g.196035 Transcript_67693/m.196035 type:complete len:238 (+) Transcript_67693:9-722(+)